MVQSARFTRAGMLNTVSIVGSVSRRAGGLFESVRRLHRELLALKSECQSSAAKGADKGQASELGRGVAVQVLSLQDEFTQRDLGAWKPVSVQTSPGYGPRAFGYAPGLLRNLLALEPDLAHVHGLWQFTSLATLVWHRKTRRPYLVSPHGMLDPWALRNSGWKKKLAWVVFERAHLRSATCLRALCQAEARAIRALGLTNPVCIIPNGVDLPEPGKEKRKAGKRESGKGWGSSNGGGVANEAEKALTAGDPILKDRKVLLYLGRIHPKKGLRNLLAAWAKVEARGDWVLAVAGWNQGRHEAELKRLASELQIHWSDARGGPNRASSLIFAGPQFGDDKDAWLRRCDGFILPSLSEGIPMSILEAWAHAKPAILTPQCNLPEGLTAGAALCTRPEPDAIASVLRHFLSLNCSAREQAGLRGRALVASRFTWPRIASDLRAVYFWMIGVGPKPDCILRG